MKWLVLLLILGAALVLVVGILHPFVLPPPMYDLLYGWRYPKMWECGTSVVTDIGPGAARHRYVVDLGAIDLQTTGTTTLTMCMVPQEVSYLFLAVSWDDNPIHVGGTIGWRNYEEISETHVSIRVTDSRGNLIAAHSGRLGHDWVWSGPNGPFLNEVWLYDTGTRIQPITGESYAVDVAVEHPSSYQPGVTLKAAGGGWK